MSSVQTARDFMILSPQQREHEDARSQEVDEMAGAGVADRSAPDDADDEDDDTEGAEEAGKAQKGKRD